MGTDFVIFFTLILGKNLYPGSVAALNSTPNLLSLPSDIYIGHQGAEGRRVTGSVQSVTIHAWNKRDLTQLLGAHLHEEGRNSILIFRRNWETF